MKNMLGFTLGIASAIIGFRYIKLDTNKIKDDFQKLKEKSKKFEEKLEEELNRDEDKDGC